MAQLIADITPLDRARVGRAVLAWHSGDRAALDRVMSELMNPADRVALPSFIFGSLDSNSRSLDQLGLSDEEIGSRLRESVARFVLMHEQGE